jgi:hypothetical protein
LITGREFCTLNCSCNLKVTPASSCVQIPGTTYSFSCAFRGETLGINGREPEEAEEQVFFPTITNLQKVGDWSRQDCVIALPSLGVWCVLFWVDGADAVISTIVTGAMLEPTSEEPTSEERIALAASLVE